MLMLAIQYDLAITPELIYVSDLKQISKSGWTVLDLFVMKEKITREVFE